MIVFFTVSCQPGLDFADCSCPHGVCVSGVALHLVLILQICAVHLLMTFQIGPVHFVLIFHLLSPPVLACVHMLTLYWFVTNCHVNLVLVCQILHVHLVCCVSHSSSTPVVGLSPVCVHLVLVCQMLLVNLVLMFQVCHVHLVLVCLICAAHLVLMY